jgi:hypothetical protein
MARVTCRPTPFRLVLPIFNTPGTCEKMRLTVEALNPHAAAICLTV